jgi:hypothetical protein
MNPSQNYHFSHQGNSPSSHDSLLSSSKGSKAKEYSMEDSEISQMNKFLGMDEADAAQDKKSDIPAASITHEASHRHSKYDESADEDSFVFLEPPSSNLMCPIHKGLFSQPVIGKCGTLLEIRLNCYRPFFLQTMLKNRH